MTKVVRHLITTADERTWRFDSPVLFLGEWCRLYNRKALWMDMDGEVATPFRSKGEKKSDDINYLDSLFAKLLDEISSSLNAFHHTNRSSRYWNILLGHWLKRYVKVCYNRYFTIEQVLKSNQIASTAIFVSTDFSFATLDSLSFSEACNNDVWNNMLYARVLKYMDCKDIELDLVDIKNEGYFKQDRGVLPARASIIKQLIKTTCYSILPKFSRRNDAFIINSYLPTWQEIKLQIALWQIPQRWQSPVQLPTMIDIKMRDKFMISSELYSGFENFVRVLLPEMIPTCYLEGFTQLNQQVESLPWPSKPKFIFTSNNFDTDEIFKAWAGLKTEEGVPYFIGQHGNNYGTLQGSKNWPEKLSVDNFFTWGWVNENIKNTPAFVFKTDNTRMKTKPGGGLLLLEVHAPPMTSLDDVFYEFSIYQEQQFRFVEALPKEIQKELTVRLHDSWVKTRWSDDERWNDYKASIPIDPGVDSVKKIIEKNRLVVHSYDSTGILEGLASNIPTLCFWNGGLDHLLPSAKPYYELLRGAGILAVSPEHAALLVVQYWDDIDGWWKSEKVQSARRLFCEQYARVENFPVLTMKRLLTAATLNQKNQTESRLLELQ
jgi:putative transferase (TIGR04331 family)